MRLSSLRKAKQKSFWKEKEIPQTIATIRTMLNLTQAQFGEAIGISRRTVCKYENGDMVPGRDIRKKIYEYAEQAGVTSGVMLEIRERQIDELKAIISNLETRVSSLEASMVVYYTSLSDSTSTTAQTILKMPSANR